VSSDAAAAGHGLPLNSPAGQGLPSDLFERARRVRLVGFDVDGTLTDGRLYFDDSGRESKAFHVQDGLGLKLLEDAGIAVAIVTARESAAAKARARDLKLRHVFTAVKDKRACLSALAAELGFGLDACGYFGDDLPDVGLYPVVARAGAPADGHAWVRERAHWVSAARGGRGAAREFCDLILTAQDRRAAILAGYGAA
jgi:3-deoxy-D-manno-octulosonate 8-phosphate phosphatase (KDO 8-P phosphatase)